MFFNMIKEGIWDPVKDAKKNLSKIYMNAYYGVYNETTGQE